MCFLLLYTKYSARTVIFTYSGSFSFLTCRFAYRIYSAHAIAVRSKPIQLPACMFLLRWQAPRL